MADIELKLASVQERLSFLQSELENPQRQEEEILQIHQEIFTLEGVIPILEEKLARFNDYANANNQQYNQQDELHNGQEDEDEDYEYGDYNDNQFYGPAQAMKRSRYQPYQSQHLQQLQQSQQLPNSIHNQQLPNSIHDQQLVQLNELIQQQRHNNEENQDLYQYIDLLQAKLLATEQLLEAKDIELTETKAKLSTALKQIRNNNQQQQIQLQSRSPLLIDWRNDPIVNSAQKQYYQNIETILNENAIAMKQVCPDVVFEIADYCQCDHQVPNQSLGDAFDLAIGLHSMTDELPDENDPIYVIFGSNRGKIKLQVHGNGAIVDMNNAMLYDFLNPGTQHGWVKGCGGSKDSTQHYHIEFTW